MREEKILYYYYYVNSLRENPISSLMKFILGT